MDITTLQSIANYNTWKNFTEYLVLNKVNYESVLFANIPKYLLKKLQWILNAATNFIFQKYITEHNYLSLGWLPVIE